MKTIEITFINDVTVITREVKTGKKLDNSRVVGTVLNDLFRLVSLQQKTKTKFFNFSKPFDIRVKTEDVLIDTAKIKSIYKTRFKLNNTAKRKKSFAQAVYHVIDFATTKTEVLSYQELEKKLNNETI